MKTIILSTVLAVLVATTGAVSASAAAFGSYPAWAQDAFTGSRN